MVWTYTIENTASLISNAQLSLTTETSALIQEEFVQTGLSTYQRNPSDSIHNSEGGTPLWQCPFFPHLICYCPELNLALNLKFA